MPFETRAEWTLTNDATETVELAAMVEVSDSVPSEPFGRLHAQRFETLGPTAETHHPMVSAPGPGRLAGVCLMMQGHEIPDGGFFASPFNFLEGDERGVVDGALAIAGTGTEDYLNGAFYFEHGPAVTPFAQWFGIDTGTAGDPSQGRVTGCRWL